MDDRVVETLRAAPLFAALSDDGLEAVAGQVSIRAVARNGFVFRRGAPCAGLHIVVEGRVKVYRASPDGREQILHVEGPGRPLAELPLFDGGPYPASARALEDSRLLFLSRDAFQRLYRSHPEIADAVIGDLARRLRRMVRLVDTIALKEVPARVASALAEDAAEAGVMRDGGEFRLGRTQEALAEELATTRESVARALAALRGAGIIHQRGARIVILNALHLDAVARGSMAPVRPDRAAVAP